MIRLGHERDCVCWDCLGEMIAEDIWWSGFWSGWRAARLALTGVQANGLGEGRRAQAGGEHGNQANLNGSRGPADPPAPAGALAGTEEGDAVEVVFEADLLDGL